MRLSAKSSLSRTIAMDALLVCAALLLSYLELLIPVSAVIPLPGIKLGLANLAVMLAACYGGNRDAAVVSLMRVAISAVLFGSVSSFFFSVTGASLSYLALVLLPRLFCGRLSWIGLSVACAVMHNLGQAAVAAVLLSDTAALAYLPILMLAGIITGMVNGILMCGITGRLKRW